MSIVLSNLNNLLFESEIEIDDKFISISESVSKTFKQQYADLVKQQEDLVGKKLLHRKMDDPDMGPFNVQSAIEKGPLANPPLHNDNAIAAMKARPHVDTKGSGDSISYLKQQQLRQSHDPYDQALYSGDKIKTYGHSNDLSDHALYTGAKGAKLPVTKVNMDDGAPSIAQKALKWGADNSTTIAAVSGAVLGAGLLAKYKNSILRGNYLVNHYSKLASQAKNPAEKQQYEQRIAWAKSKLANAQSKARVEHKNFIEKSQRMKSYINELNKAGRKQEAAKLQEKLAKRQRFLSKIGATV